MKKGFLSILIVGLFLLSSTGLVQAANWANPDLLVTAEQVKKNIDKPNWVVVDCRDLKKYIKGHIPGAISLGKRCKKALRDPSARLFRDVSWYEKFLGKVGIGNDTHVVFYYGDIKDLPDATVGFWTLEYLGHDKVHVLNGGIEAWRKAGYRLDKKPVKKAPKTFKAKVVKSRYAETEEILKIAQGKLKDVQLIDSRTKKEFVGKDCRALRCGHVPNVTINVSHIDTLPKVKDPKTGKKKPIPVLDPDVVSKAFAKLDKNKRTIGYCQTGTRSTLTYLELRLLGFKDPANWDESWRVWGSHYNDYPVEAPNGEQWYNFAKVNKTLKKLKKEVKKLKQQLKQGK
ncbi:MAG TPA: sulfurtransferase [Nitrospirae bacterium]|nr:sulfurtransferase [Nitrospirota bacterium]